MATPEKFGKFCESFLKYLDAAVRGSERREEKKVLDYENYMKERFFDVGIFVLRELTMIICDIDIPEEITKSDEHKKLLKLTSEIIFIANVKFIIISIIIYKTNLYLGHSFVF